MHLTLQILIRSQRGILQIHCQGLSRLDSHGLGHATGEPFKTPFFSLVALQHPKDPNHKLRVNAFVWWCLMHKYCPHMSTSSSSSSSSSSPIMTHRCMDVLVSSILYWYFFLHNLPVPINWMHTGPYYTWKKPNWIQMVRTSKTLDMSLLD